MSISFHLYQFNKFWFFLVYAISSKQNTQYEFRFLDSQGNIIKDLCEDEIREIQRKNIVVWSN